MIPSVLASVLKLPILDVMNVIYTLASKNQLMSLGVDMPMQQRYVLPLVTTLPGNVDLAVSHGLKLVMGQ